MAAVICITSFHSGGAHYQIGDTADSGDAAYTNNTAFWELVAVASTSTALTSHAYGTLVINKGDNILTANAAVSANSTWFSTSGQAPAIAARKERLGAHR